MFCAYVNFEVMNHNLGARVKHGDCGSWCLRFDQ
jgi:hypothetical protein